MYQEERKNDLPIFSHYIAGNLLLMGHKMYNMSKNKKFPDKNVFYFRDCQEVRDAVEKLKKDLANKEQA